MTAPRDREFWWLRTPVGVQIGQYSSRFLRWYTCGDENGWDERACVQLRKVSRPKELAPQKE